MRTTTALTVCLLILSGCGDDDGARESRALAAHESQAVAALVDNLADPDFESSQGAFGLSNQVFAVGFLVSLPAASPSGFDMRRGALGEECVVESGNVITYTCPTVTGTVTTIGDSFELDLTIIPTQGQWSSMRITGTITLGEGYSNGRLYYEIDTGSGSAMMTCDWEAWTSGPSDRGWMTFTWSDPEIFGSEYELVRVVWDGDSETVTYE
ncbi:MAG: hypothetical protein IT385_10485 [Deltaproteobacteria bacterium]|nr:hypothetical protein [Deltaproteobacteria bacterium]